MKLLYKVSGLTALKDAWKEVQSGKKEDVRQHSKGYDDESIADFGKNADANLIEISTSLLGSKYKMTPLYAFEKEKKSPGKFRLITVPSVRDRIVHTAILSAIQEYFPQIRNESSYCLPKNKTKIIGPVDAFRSIVDHASKGNHYVFESDIKSFFDKVNKKRLFNKIKNSLPDQSLDELIRQIIYFSVGNITKFNKLSASGKIQLPETSIGLGQGSPLSPLFANIYLVDFDRSMIKAFGKKYIRYVDDFIVLCQSSEETANALQLATELLSDEGLSLPPDTHDINSKTRINIDLKNGDSFIFLGNKISKDSIEPNYTVGQLKLYIDEKCFAIYKIKVILSTTKHQTSNQNVEDIVNKRIQSKFGMFGYYHTAETLTIINELIQKKANQTKLNIKPIIPKKRGMPIISQQDWQNLFL